VRPVLSAPDGGELSTTGRNDRFEPDAWIHHRLTVMAARRNIYVGGVGACEVLCASVLAARPAAAVTYTRLNALKVAAVA